MKPLVPSICLIALVVLVITASRASAEEWLHLDPLEAELILEYDSFWRRGKTREGTVDFDFEESLRIRQSGYSLDRKIATFFIEIEPTFSQGQFSGDGQNQSRNGNFLNFSGNLSLLHGTPGPFSLNINASRTSGIIDGSLGNRTRFINATRRVALNWKTKLLPTTLSYEERSLDQSFRSSLTLNATERNDILRTLSVRSRNRKLNFLAERQWLNDRVSARDQDYTLSRGRLGHSFKWGKGSRLDTRFELTDRQGFNANSRLSATETAAIQHTDTLSSTTNYSFTSSDQNDQTTEHRGNFRLTHRLYKNLTSAGYMRGSLRRAVFRDQDEYEFGGNINYNKSELLGAKVSAGIGGSYRRTNRRSENGRLSVTDESHSIAALGIALLVERFVDAATLIVTDATGAFVFTEGLDYEIIQVVDDFTEIRIIPGGQIADGDTILVSYKFASLPSQQFETVSYSYNLSLDFGWIRLSHQSSRSDQGFLSGAGSGFLTDRRNTSSEIEFKWSSKKARASLKGSRRVARSGQFNTTTYGIRQSAFYQPSRKLTLTLSAREIFATTGGRSTKQFSIDQSATWTPARGWQVRPRLGAWLRKETGQSVVGGSRTDLFMTAGFNLRWNWRRIRVDLRYNHNLRSGDLEDTAEDRVMLTLRRKF